MNSRVAHPVAGSVLALRVGRPALRVAGGTLLLTLLLSRPAGATTWVVHPDGTGDAPDLQAAVADAVGGDTILLGPGTFSGPGNRGVVIVAKDLFVESVSGPAATVIDCQSVDRAFTIFNSNTLFVGITIRNGASFSAGGAVFASSSTTTCKNCRFEDNSGAGEASAGGGGAVYVSGGHLVVSSCRFDRNHASSEHGVGAGICVEGGNALVTDSVFESNSTGTGQYSGGAGLFSWQAQNVVVDGCTFSNNTATAAAALFLFSETASVARSGFSGNSGDTIVATLAESPSDVMDCTFTSNHGTALDVNRGAAVSRCEFIANSATRWGGAVFTGAKSLSFVDCTFAKNSAAVAGGALYNLGSSTVSFDRCTFVGNVAPAGAHVYNAYVANLVFERSILVSASGPAANCEGGGTITATCCDIFGNSGGDYVDCLAGQNGTDGNFAADPRFCGPEVGDFALRSDSPCAPPGVTACGLVGAHPVACGPTSTEARSWARVKVLYHD